MNKESIQQAWDHYCETDDYSKFTDEVSRWADIQVRLMDLPNGVDHEDIVQELIAKFLEKWEPNWLDRFALLELHLTTRTIKSHILPIPQGRDPDSVPLVQHDPAKVLERKDWVHHIRDTMNDAPEEIWEIWEACLELGSDPVAIRRTYGQYQGNQMLLAIKKYLVNHTDIAIEL